MLLDWRFKRAPWRDEEQMAETDQELDYVEEGRKMDLKLLRGLALGGRRSNEIQLLLDSQADGQADYQALALALADYSAPEKKARATFSLLRRHQENLSARLGRPLGIRAAALDLLENLERALDLPEEQVLTYNQLHQMAFHDHLTGLSNFRYFTLRYSEEVKRAGRYRHLLSLVMIDIDHFKSFNDRFGHPAGNFALEHLSRLLGAELRDTDLAGRYGGEEFAIILPETSKQEALRMAERLRVRMESSPVPLNDDGPQRLTISLGVATYPRDAHDPESLLAGADAALYAAKKAGRNRVEAFIPTTGVDLVFAPSNPGSVQQVHVVGDFNNWTPSADPLWLQEGGSWRLHLALAPGRYEYKYVLNSDWYMADPACAETVQDGYGGRNSVLRVAG
jgi:diguanylate cyclase (GGDEF)-like protein